MNALLRITKKANNCQTVGLLPYGNVNAKCTKLTFMKIIHRALGGLLAKRRRTKVLTYGAAACGVVTILGLLLSTGPYAPAADTPKPDLAGLSEGPICGRLNDRGPMPPADWDSFKAPSSGQSYKDATFGCQITRLTDGSTEETLSDGRHLDFSHGYSTFSPLSADDTLLWIEAGNGTSRIRDIRGKIIVPSDSMPARNSGHAVWDAVDGKSFYYARGNKLYRGTVEGRGVKTAMLHTFTEYQGVVSPDHADLSQDGDHLALIGQNPDNSMDIFVWSIKSKIKASTYRTACTVSGEITGTGQPGCMHKLLLTANNLPLIAFVDSGPGVEQGLRLWDGHSLAHIQDGTNHADTGYDLSGNSIFIASNNKTTLAGLSNPCPSGWGLDVRQLARLADAVCLLDKQPCWHVSYRGGLEQPWSAISFCDTRKTGPEFYRTDPRYEAPTAANWQLYEDEIMLARIDGKATYRVAYARSRSEEGYADEPRAAISRDGKYIVFTSDMAHPDGCPANMLVANQCTDVYIIRVR